MLPEGPLVVSESESFADRSTLPATLSVVDAVGEADPAVLVSAGVVFGPPTMTVVVGV